jgi:cytochrome c
MRFRRSCRIMLVSIIVLAIACRGKSTSPIDNIKDSHPTKDYIKRIEGKSDTISQVSAQRGEVLIAYSDCYTCHTKETRSKGPSFRDIAERYPVSQGYIELLARRIIIGGNGLWGNPVMSPHPDLSVRDARIMAHYILSLKKR